MKKFMMNVDELDSQTVLIYSLSSIIIAIMALVFPGKSISSVMMVVQMIVILYSLILASLAIRKKINRFWRNTTIILYTLTYLGMWFSLSLSHHMVMVYLLSIMILSVLLTRGIDRIIIIGFHTLMVTSNIYYDLVIRGPVISDAPIHQKYIMVIAISLGMMITGGMNRLALEDAAAELTFFSMKDHLTGAMNKRAFDEYIEHLILNAKSIGNNFALVYIDLDNFKSVNDNYGHDEGDQVLIECVSYFKEHIRKSDRIYRVGGDEFVIVMDKTSADEAIRILQRIIDNQFIANIQRYQVGYSVGIVDLFSAMDEGKDIVKLADEKMYHTKRDKKAKLL